MEPFLLRVFTIAGITLGAAIGVAAIDRFRNAAAGGLALAGGLMPWLTLVMLYFVPNSPAIGLALVFIGPLFLMAFLCFSVEKPRANRNLCAALTISGLISGVIFSFFFGYTLLMANI